MDSPCIKQTVCKVLKIFQHGKYLVAYVLKLQLHNYIRHTLTENVNNWYQINALSHIIDWSKDGVKFPLNGDIPVFEFQNKFLKVLLELNYLTCY